MYLIVLSNYRNGAVDHVEFDKMVEAAVIAPRRFGLAPSTESMFKDDADRVATRKRDFDTMDTKKTGFISFDEWLHYAVNHIIKKVAGL